ncbi:MAG: carbohydrate kinase family protein [Lachnospiraceae bacterium]|nr:carbohydrate kinase family protein [Lachnospiraceae bacterium]
MSDEKKLQLVRKLRAADPGKTRALIGFDGFVDTVVHPVDTRTGPDTYVRIRTIRDYGEKFLAAAGLSMNIEMVPHESKIGGISAILANSLSLLGLDLTFIGACGEDALVPVYKEMAGRSKVYSICDPATSDAIEFMDGKVISSKLEPLKNANWEHVCKHIPLDALVDIYDSADLIGYGGWALSINVNSIWKGVINEVFPRMKSTGKKQMFFDLSDPAKRTKEDILEAIDLIRAHRDRFTVGIGFNEKESFEICELYGKTRNDFSSMREVPEFLREKLGLAYVVVHPVKSACGCDGETSAEVWGPFCAEPRLTTGAGDNFNAGFLTARMLGLPLDECLMTGTANSGFYVRNARSATYGELCDFMEDWGNGKVTG